MRFPKNSPAIMLLLALGCAPSATIPVATLSDMTEKIDWSHFGLTLARVVEDGRVNYGRLMEDVGPLSRTLAMLAAHGPKTTPHAFPDRDSRLAYDINAYHATILRSALACARDGQLPRRVPADFERRYRFRIDGRQQSPADLRAAAFREADGDYRVRFALCDGRRGGPPIPTRPFTPDLLDGQLNFVMRTALYAPQIVRIDHGAPKRLWLWQGLYEIRDRLVAEYERQVGASDATILNALGQFSNRRRRQLLNAAVGYDVEAMPMDGDFNQTDPPPPAAEPGVFRLF
jgi:hypothetical protein